MFNPILDKLFRVNMSHQCHHARPNDEEHMGNLPIHHLVPSLRKKDIEKYDTIFNTKISAWAADYQDVFLGEIQMLQAISSSRKASKDPLNQPYED